MIGNNKVSLAIEGQIRFIETALSVNPPRLLDAFMALRNILMENYPLSFAEVQSLTNSLNRLAAENLDQIKFPENLSFNATVQLTFNEHIEQFYGLLIKRYIQTQRLTAMEQSQLFISIAETHKRFEDINLEKILYYRAQALCEISSGAEETTDKESAMQQQKLQMRRLQRQLLQQEVKFYLQMVSIYHKPFLDKLNCLSRSTSNLAEDILPVSEWPAFTTRAMSELIFFQKFESWLINEGVQQNHHFYWTMQVALKTCFKSFSIQQKQLIQENYQQFEEICAKADIQVSESMKTAVESWLDLCEKHGAFLASARKQYFENSNEKGRKNYQYHVFQLLRKALQAITDFLGPAPCGWSFNVIGSYARGDMRSYSDLDPVILVKEAAAIAHPYFQIVVNLFRYYLIGLADPWEWDEEKGIIKPLGIQLDKGDWLRICKSNELTLLEESSKKMAPIRLINIPSQLAIEVAGQLEQDRDILYSPYYQEWLLAHSLLIIRPIYVASGGMQLVNNYYEALQSRLSTENRLARVGRCSLMALRDKEVKQLNLSADDIKDILRILTLTFINVSYLHLPIEQLATLEINSLFLSFSKNLHAGFVAEWRMAWETLQCWSLTYQQRNRSGLNPLLQLTSKEQQQVQNFIDILIIPFYQNVANNFLDIELPKPWSPWSDTIKQLVQQTPLHEDTLISLLVLAARHKTDNHEIIALNASVAQILWNHVVMSVQHEDADFIDNKEALVQLPTRWQREKLASLLLLLITHGANPDKVHPSYHTSILEYALSNKQLAWILLLLEVGAGRLCRQGEKLYEYLLHYVKNPIHNQAVQRGIDQLSRYHSKVAWLISKQKLFQNTAPHISGFPLGYSGKLTGVKTREVYFTAEVARQIFTIKPGAKTEEWKKVNVQGRHPVARAKIGEQLFYIKPYPEAPGREEAVQQLAEQLFDGGIAYSELFSYTDSQGQLHPVLITQGIAGFTGQDLLNALSLKENVRKQSAISSEEAEMALTHLDHYRFSQLFILTVLISNEDNNPGNLLIEKNGTQYMLISIDNDHSFFTPVIIDEKGRVILQLKSLLFCLDFMKKALHPDVITEFLALDSYKTLKRWLEDLKVSETRYRELGLKTYYERECCYIRVSFDHHAIVQLWQRWDRLKDGLQNDPLLPAEAVLRHVIPRAGLIYENALRESTLAARFEKIGASHYTMTRQNNEVTSYSSNLKAAEQLQRQKNTYNIDRALQELRRAYIEASKIEPAAEAMRRGDISLFNKLLLDSSKSAVLEKISWGKLEGQKQRDVINRLISDQVSFLTLVLRDCETLTESDLTQLLKASPSLQKLIIINNPKLTNKTWSLLEEYGSSLETIELAELPGLSIIEHVRVPGVMSRIASVVGLTTAEEKLSRLCALSISNCPNLVKMSFNTSTLEKLLLNQLPLSILTLLLPQLQQLNIKQCMQLEILNFGEYRLEKLSWILINQLKKLKEFRVQAPYLSRLEIKGCDQLERIRTESSYIERIVITECPMLKESGIRECIRRGVYLRTVQLPEKLFIKHAELLQRHHLLLAFPVGFEDKLKPQLRAYLLKTQSDAATPIARQLHELLRQYDRVMSWVQKVVPMLKNKGLKFIEYDMRVLAVCGRDEAIRTELLPLLQYIYKYPDYEHYDSWYKSILEVVKLIGNWGQDELISIDRLPLLETMLKNFGSDYDAKVCVETVKVIDMWGSNQSLRIALLPLLRTALTRNYRYWENQYGSVWALKIIKEWSCDRSLCIELLPLLHDALRFAGEIVTQEAVKLIDEWGSDELFRTELWPLLETALTKRGVAVHQALQRIIYQWGYKESFCSKLLSSLRNERWLNENTVEIIHIWGCNESLRLELLPLLLTALKQSGIVAQEALKVIDEWSRDNMLRIKLLRDRDESLHVDLLPLIATVFQAQSEAFFQQEILEVMQMPSVPQQFVKDYLLRFKLLLLIGYALTMLAETTLKEVVKMVSKWDYDKIFCMELLPFLEYACKHGRDREEISVGLKQMMIQWDYEPLLEEKFLPLLPDSYVVEVIHKWGNDVSLRDTLFPLLQAVAGSFGTAIEVVKVIGEWGHDKLFRPQVLLLLQTTLGGYWWKTETLREVVKVIDEWGNEKTSQAELLPWLIDLFRSSRSNVNDKLEVLRLLTKWGHGESFRAELLPQLRDILKVTWKDEVLWNYNRGEVIRIIYEWEKHDIAFRVDLLPLLRAVLESDWEVFCMEAQELFDKVYQRKSWLTDKDESLQWDKKRELRFRYEVVKIINDWGHGASVRVELLLLLQHAFKDKSMHQEIVNVIADCWQYKSIRTEISLLLQAVFKDDPSDILIETLKVMSKWHYDESVRVQLIPLLQYVLKTKKEKICIEVIEVINGWGCDEVSQMELIPLLQDALKTGNREVYREVVKVIAGWGRDELLRIELFPLLQQLIPKWGWTSWEYSDVQQEAMEVIIGWGDDDESLRAQILPLVSDNYKRMILPKMREWGKDKSLRIQLLEKLWMLLYDGGERVYQEVVKVLDEWGQDKSFRVEFLPLLQAALKASSNEVRYKAIKIVGEWCDNEIYRREFLPSLLEALKDVNQAIRKEAAKLLSELNYRQEAVRLLHEIDYYEEPMLHAMPVSAAELKDKQRWQISQQYEQTTKTLAEWGKNAVLRSHLLLQLEEIWDEDIIPKLPLIKIITQLAEYYYEFFDTVTQSLAEPSISLQTSLAIAFEQPLDSVQIKDHTNSPNNNNDAPSIKKLEQIDPSYDPNNNNNVLQSSSVWSTKAHFFVQPAEDIGKEELLLRYQHCVKSVQSLLNVVELKAPGILSAEILQEWQRKVMQALQSSPFNSVDAAELIEWESFEQSLLEIKSNLSTQAVI